MALTFGWSLEADKEFLPIARVSDTPMFVIDGHQIRGHTLFIVSRAKRMAASLRISAGRGRGIVYCYH